MLTNPDPGQHRYKTFQGLLGLRKDVKTDRGNKTSVEITLYFLCSKMSFSLSVAGEYISNCFGIDLGAFIPTSHPPPTRPTVKRSILPAHILPTLLSAELKKTKNICLHAKHMKCAVCVFIFCASVLWHTVLLSRINSECSRRVSLFLPRDYLHYVNHGCNDVHSIQFLSLHPSAILTPRGSHTPTRPVFSADLRPAWVSAGAAVWSWADLTWLWSQFRGEGGLLSCV